MVIVLLLVAFTAIVQAWPLTVLVLVLTSGSFTAGSHPELQRVVIAGTGIVHIA